MNSKALFGGALLFAGLTANAQEFVFADSGNYAGQTFNSFSTTFVGSYVFGPYQQNQILSQDGDVNQSLSAYGSTSTTSRDANNLRAEAVWDGSDPFATGYGYAGGNIQQFFQVSQDADLVISWDLSDTDFFGNVIFFIDDGANTLNLTIGAGNAAGSETLSLQAGVDYGIFFDLGVPFLFEANQPIFINAELVPAPASAGLLAAGGLLALRRRRA